MTLIENALEHLTDLRKKILSFDESFEDLVLEIEKLIENIIIDINKIFSEISTEGKTGNYISLVDNLLSKIDKLSIPSIPIDLSNTKVDLETVTGEIEKVKALLIVSNIKNTIVIVGANGAGKSSFVSNLKETSLPNLCVIPAQKYLFFDKDTYKRESVTITSYQGSLANNYIKLARSKLSGSQLDGYFSYPFTYLITALIKEFSDIATRKMRNEVGFQYKVPKLTELEEIWKELIPNISFEIDSNNREIFVLKDGNKFALNGLSDGEKCIIFYIGNILIAPENSYIVVDEPETFLNPSIYNKLWDSLIKKRQDCQFIFTSHTMDFVNSRTNCSYLWCKKFIYPNEFELKVLDKENDFPISLLTELLGSKKPILFCEGEYSSLDYQIFSKIFSDDYHVKPVGGHDNVVNYTKGYNEISRVHENKAIGIIDSDFLNDHEIEKYKSFSVYTLPFNEIEMFLLDENIISSVLSAFKQKEEIVSIISTFKDEFKQEIKKSNSKIVLQATKKQLDRKISTSLIQEYSSIEKIALEVQNLPTKINPQAVYESVREKLSELLEADDYNSLLRICNLKKQMTRGLASSTIMENYESRAIERIQIDEELQSLLKTLYFSELE